MGLTSYSTGTVSVSAGGTTVTGTGTIWSGTNARPGDILQIGNFQTIISDVPDTDTLTIPPWGGGAQTDVAYTIWQWFPQRVAGAQAMADVSTLVAALNKDGFYWFVDVAETEPDPSLGNDGQYASQPTTGKTWVKVGGTWTFLGIYRGLQLKGAWSGVTAYSVNDIVTLSGSSYACVLDHTNHTPPNATYWQLLAERGTDGDAATVVVGTVTTGAGGSAADVTNSGTSSAAVFDFTIPAGKSYGGTSTTSLTIGTGSKVFTTQAGLAYTNGARVRASSAANTSNWMEGLAAYSGTTLTINVDKTNGSGTLADWNFNVVGEPGAGDLSSANNLSDLADPATARGNLGLTESIVTATIGHLPGIASNTAASTGEVGEVISASGTSGTLTSSTVAALGSISLTAGDWDISATIQFNAQGGTTSTDYNGAISTTSASLTPYGTSIAFTQRVPASADHSENFAIPPVQALINATTSFFLNARSVFTITYRVFRTFRIDGFF
ncbi:hypothetical protein A1D31_35720 [Bradyrhizobium liaoningense]|nr:hypothetical protein A1D31_35720 [Bradyrhizobium liaoningense]